MAVLEGASGAEGAVVDARRIDLNAAYTIPLEELLEATGIGEKCAVVQERSGAMV